MNNQYCIGQMVKIRKADKINYSKEHQASFSSLINAVYSGCRLFPGHILPVPEALGLCETVHRIESVTKHKERFLYSLSGVNDFVFDAETIEPFTSRLKHVLRGDTGWENQSFPLAKR